MKEQRKKEAEGSIIIDILFALRRNIIIVLITIFLCACCGLGGAYLKKPNYVAAENVIYKAEQAAGGGGYAADINIMRAYFNTIIDFCDEGVVTDRANYYYVNFLNAKNSSDEEISVSDYLKTISQDDDGYANSTNVNKSYILKEKIATSADVSSADSEQFSFVIRYTDENKIDAYNKVKILVFAMQMELDSNDYFEAIDNQVITLGSLGVTSDVSKTKAVLIGALAGVVVAAIIVYLRVIFDKTITSKEVLEELTGTTVLAVVEKEGGKE